LLRAEFGYAREKIHWRTRWDPDAAAGRIAAGPSKEFRYEELALLRWLRAQFRGRDPEGYLAVALRHPPPEYDRAAAGDIRKAVDALGSVFNPRVRPLIDELLRVSAPSVRVHVAKRLLVADPSDSGAIAALRAVAWDRRNPAPPSVPAKDWPRVEAIRELAARSLLDADDARARIAAEDLDHALVLDALFEFLATTPRPAEDSERRDVWRRVVRGPVDLGAVSAAERLLDMRDHEWRIPILAALERARKWSGAGSRELRRQVDRLAERAAVEMPRQPPPK
jgi:hypothetical protein